jgi:hypothetical protein
MSFWALLGIGWAVTFALVGIGVYLATRNYYDPKDPSKP